MKVAEGGVGSWEGQWQRGSYGSFNVRFIFKNQNHASPPAFKRKRSNDIEDDFNPGSAAFGVRRDRLLSGSQVTLRESPNPPEHLDSNSIVDSGHNGAG